MARARNIKPSFFQNEELGELNPIDRLAFIGMWTIADFKGCIELRPKRLKVQLLPYDECDFELITNNLEQSGFISTYSVLGQRYIKIINFEKHQNPHKNERESGSEIPDINLRDDFTIKNNDLENIEINPDKNGTAPADSLLLIPDSLNPQPDSFSFAAEKSAPPAKVDSEKELQEACKETWKFYTDAFFNRYGTEPVRNSKVNSQVKQFVKRIGYSESPLVAASFVSNNTQYYVSRGHSVDCLLADAEKIRTEWATGNVMTNTRANQIDKSQANKSAVSEAMQLLGATS